MPDTPVSSHVYVKSGASSGQIATAQEAINDMSYASIDTIVLARTDITFLTPSQMIAHGFVIPGGKAAWGYTLPSQRNTFVNGSLPKREMKYTCLHEVGGHMGDHDSNSRTNRDSLGALMHSAGNANDWASGPYAARPDECFADQFPRAYAGYGNVAGYYLRQIPTSNYAAYRSIVGTGGGSPNPPQTSTLAANSSVGATNIKYGGTWHVGDWILIDSGVSQEYREVTAVGTSGGGGTGLTLDSALAISHSSGAALKEAAPPPTTGGIVSPSFFQQASYTVLDLVREVRNTLRPRNGGTGNTRGWGRGVLFDGYNSTGATLPLYSIVRSTGAANTVEPTTTANEGDVLGVVVGYFDGYGSVVEEDCPAGYEPAVLMQGVTEVLVETAGVARGDYAFAAGTDGLATNSASAGTGMFGQFLSGAGTGLVATVRLFGPGAAGTGGGSTSFGTPSLTLGTANGAGTGSNAIRNNATVAAFDSAAPVTQAFADAAATGAAAVAARRDHKHGMPSVGSFALLSSLAHSATTGRTVNDHHNEDHSHSGTPAQQLVQANTHQSPDTDSGLAALHHTLGIGSDQASPGDHTHTGSGSIAIGLAYYGTGVDGAVDLDGSNTYTALGITKSGSVYTQTRDLMLTDLTIRAAVTLKPAGYKMMCSGTLNIIATGIIDRNGNNATGQTAGGANGNGTTRAGTAGANGNVNGAGSTGGGDGNAVLTGGTGGTGGNAGASNGGTGLGAFATVIGMWAHLIPLSLGAVINSFTGGGWVNFGGGSGGGSGACTSGGSTGSSGAGGGGAGCIIIIAKTITNAGTIRADGGNGGNGVLNGATTAAAGGGGGGGGSVILIYRSLTNTGTISANGGTKGTSAGTATAATDGNPGRVISLTV